MANDKVIDKTINGIEAENSDVNDNSVKPEDDLILRLAGFDFLRDNNGNPQPIRFMVFTVWRKNLNGSYDQLVDEVNGVQIPARINSLPVNITPQTQKPTLLVPQNRIIH